MPEGKKFCPALGESAPVVVPRCMWRGYGGLEGSEETPETPQAIGCGIQTQTDRQPGRQGEVLKVHTEISDR